MNKKLKYEKFCNSDNIITIDLHNGYTVIAISTWDTEKKCYIVTLLLKDNTIDTWKLIEDAELLEFNTTEKLINSAILKHVATLLEENFFDYYINRYEYELKCFDLGNDIYEKEMIGEK